MGSYNKPTKDTVRRRQAHSQFSRETVRFIPQSATQTSTSGRADIDAYGFGQHQAELGAQAVSSYEARQTGKMCLRDLMRSPHFQAHAPQPAAQPAQA